MWQSRQSRSPRGAWKRHDRHVLTGPGRQGGLVVGGGAVRTPDTGRGICPWGLHTAGREVGPHPLGKAPESNRIRASDCLALARGSLWKQREEPVVNVSLNRGEKEA